MYQTILFIETKCKITSRKEWFTQNIGYGLLFEYCVVPVAESGRKRDVNGFSKFYVYWVGRKYGCGFIFTFFINGCFGEDEYTQPQNMDENKK